MVKSSHYFFLVWFGLVWLSVVKALKQVSALLRTVQSSSCTSLFAPTLLRSIRTAICANNLHQTCTKHTLAALTLLYKSFVQTTCTKQFALHYLPRHYTWFHSHCYSNSSNCSVQKQPCIHLPTLYCTNHLHRTTFTCTWGRSESFSYFVPQKSHRQAGSAWPNTSATCICSIGRCIPTPICTACTATYAIQFGCESNSAAPTNNLLFICIMDAA